MLSRAYFRTALIFSQLLVGFVHPEIDDDQEAWSRSAWPPDSSSLMPFEKDGLFGYISQNGKIVIPPRFRIAYPFYPEGSAAIVDSNGMGHYIDRQGNLRFRAYAFDNGPDPFFDGFARYVHQGKIGFIDKSLKVRIPAKFGDAYYFRWGWAAYCEGCEHALRLEEPDFRYSGPPLKGKWGIIDTLGHRITPPIYAEVRIISKDMARACMTSSCALDGEDAGTTGKSSWIRLNRKGKPFN